MIALGHSASGVVLGLAGGSIVSAGLANPAMLIPLTLMGGVGLHYAGDWLPHGHYKFDLQKDRQRSLLKLVSDLVLPIALILYLAWSNFGFDAEWWLIATALIGVQLPDIFENLVDLKVLPNGQFAQEHRAYHYDKLHRRNSSSRWSSYQRPLSWLDIYQLALLGLALYLLI